MNAAILTRPAVLADAPFIATINADGWRINYVGLIPAATLARVEAKPDKWALAIDRAPRPWHVTVAADGGGVVGFVTFLPQRDDALAADGYTGEISALYVAPARQGQGIGRALFHHVRREATDDGWTGIGVWTLAESAQSCGFYAAVGGRKVATRTDLFDDITVPEVGFGWRLGNHNST